MTRFACHKRDLSTLLRCDDLSGRDQDSVATNTVCVLWMSGFTAFWNRAFPWGTSPCPRYMASAIKKLLLVIGEHLSGRSTIILVKQNQGF